MEAGIHGEVTADYIAVNVMGLHRTGYDPGYHGIDNIYRDDDGRLVLMESKWGSRFGQSSLTQKKDEPAQMSEQWIRRSAAYMVLSGSAENKKLGGEILSDLNSRIPSIRRILININQRGYRCYEASWQTGSWRAIEAHGYE